MFKFLVSTQKIIFDTRFIHSVFMNKKVLRLNNVLRPTVNNIFNLIPVSLKVTDNETQDSPTTTKRKRENNADSKNESYK